MPNHARILIALVCVVGCGGESERELAVDIVTDFVPGVEFDTIAVSVPGEDSMRFVASETADYPAGVRFADLVLPQGDHLVSVALIAGGRTIITKTHLITLQADLGITFVLPRSCTSVICGDRETCVAGACADNRCTPETPEFCPAPECMIASDCDLPVCGLRSCASGTCLQSDDGSCGVGFYCSPDIGCLPRPSGTDAGPDARAPDAGPDPDVGPDAPEMDAGCIPESDPGFCLSQSRVCGRVTGIDRCGAVRDLDCGDCVAGSHCAGVSCEPCTMTPCESGLYTDFEGATPGTSVTGFQGWKAHACAPYDQEIVDDGTGNMVLRFSNAVATPCIASVLADCPAGHVITPSTWETNPDLFAGEPTLAVSYNRFVHEMRFRSATGAAQMDLWMELSADDGNGRRQSRVVINDVGTGLRIGDAAGRIHFAGLSYDAWHTIRVEIDFVDGMANDTVQITVDGVPSPLRPFVGTLETYYRTEEPAAGITAVQCTLLHPGIASTQVPALAGGGLFFDDVTTWLESR